MKPKNIRELVKIVEESGISELEVTKWGCKVRIIKNGYRNNNIIEKEPAQTVQRSVSEVVVNTPQPESKIEEPAPPAVKENLLEVKSPIVGTFYSAPSPDSPDYVEIGDTVRKGQKLCIVEAMKVMNEIESEFSGTIAEILIENAQPVDFNAVLFKIKP